MAYFRKPNRLCLCLRIKTVLNDGIKGLPLSSVTDISICGMGGELIAEILEKGKTKDYYNINFILNPMTRDDELRIYLCENGFEIKAEKAVLQSGKVYTVLLASYSGEKSEITKAQSLIGPFKGETEAERAYIEKVINRYKKQLCDKNKAQKSQEIINELEKIKNDRW